MVTPEQLATWDQQHVWHPFTQMAEYDPFIIERAEGCTLIDIHGNLYLDGVSSLWCNVHGHRHPQIDAAIRRQLDQVAHVTSLGQSHPTTIQLARKLAEISPAGLEHVFFSDSGATAVEVALKMAFQFWRQCPSPEPRRTKFIAFDAAYHGDTIGSVSVGGVARFHDMFRPLLFDVIRLPLPNAFRPPSGVASEELVAQSLRALETTLEQEDGRIVAVVMEPLVQCAAGMVFHPPGLLRGVREITAKHNVFLIADEVAVGFGRTGTMFACEQEQVSPDLLCLAKGLSGGYLPVGATLATTQIYSAFLGSYESSRTFFHGHTYGGNPLGCAAALASLEVFEQERTLEELPLKTQRLAGWLEQLSAHPHVARMRQRGLLAAFDLVVDQASGEPFPWSQKKGIALCQRTLQHGVWLRPLGSTIVIMPPLAIQLAEIDLIGQALVASLREEFGSRENHK